MPAPALGGQAGKLSVLYKNKFIQRTIYKKTLQYKYNSSICRNQGKNIGITVNISGKK
jgi:hypothetical protein